MINGLIVALIVLSSPGQNHPVEKHFAGTRQSSVSSAAVEGRLTVTESESRQVTDKPLSRQTVYLVDLEQGRAFQDLQHKCRLATANQKIDAASAYNICAQNLAEAVKLVPTLTSVASTQTDADGTFVFQNVSPARQYQVVSVKVEDDEPVVIVGLTPKLRPGDHVRLDLRENDPWTNADPLGDNSTTPQAITGSSRNGARHGGGQGAKTRPPTH